MATKELRDFFAALSSEAEILGLKGQQETVHLEFKEKADSTTPEIGKGDAQLFSRALSGFANSDGGVLIWGIEDQAGAAVDFKPIVDAEEFAKRLGNSVLNSTAPVVEGVEIITIRTAANARFGYVKCLIPASETAPHRAQLDRREYFKRSATSFYPLEHFDLEDMFGRRLKPSLCVHLALVPHANPFPNRRKIQFFVSNDGRWLAKYPSLICRLPNGPRILSVDGSITDQSPSNHGVATVTYQENIGVVHPTGVVASIGTAYIETDDALSNVAYEITWCCEGMPVRKAKGSLKHNTMKTAKPD